MLKNAGSEKPKKNSYEYIRCPYCKSKINIAKAEELGNYEKIANITIVWCENCQREFQE